MKTKARELKDNCYTTLNNYKESDTLLSNKDKQTIKLLEDILEREVMIDIDLLFNEDGSLITKRDYGYILVCKLVEDLANKYLDKDFGGR